MAWTTPMTFVSNNVLTAAHLNTYLRDNLLETEAAKATASHGIIMSGGLNKIVERIAQVNTVAASESSSSTSYTDLDTVGPTVTSETGSRALVILHCEMSNGTDNAQTVMSYQVSGNTTKAANDATALIIDGLKAEKKVRWGIPSIVDDLTPGTNTFTAKYRVGSSTNGFWANRQLLVIPF